MGRGEPPQDADGVRSHGTDTLDLLAAHALQARQDREWARRAHRQRLLVGGAVLLCVSLTVGLLMVFRSGGVGPEVGTAAPTGTATGGSDAALARAPVTTPSAAPPSGAPSSPLRATTPRTNLALAMYGRPDSGLPWHSGFWTGGVGNTAHVRAAGRWRGTSMDFVTVYPTYGTWAEIQDSSWAISSYAGFKGRLSYGLPLLPKDRKGRWEDVTSGARDAVFRGIARDLVRYGHGDAAIRMGVEANGYWFPWAVTADTVDEFHAAYRRIRTVMLAAAPDLTFWLDLNAGTALTGGNDRLDSLVRMYPGDDVVDGISMDHYNRFKLLASDEASWLRAISPGWAPGLQDAATFARLHGKGFAVPEWGLDGVQGPGDSPFFMQRMWDFFVENSDVLVYENYFNEPDPYIRGGMFESTQNPRSAAVYRSLWGRRG